jgi:hypothetical protein
MLFSLYNINLNFNNKEINNNDINKSKDYPVILLAKLFFLSSVSFSLLYNTDIKSI